MLGHRSATSSEARRPAHQYNLGIFGAPLFETPADAPFPDFLGDNGLRLNVILNVYEM